MSEYVNFESKWNDRWELQTDVSPADWLKDSFTEVSSERMESGPGIPVRSIMGKGWESYLCLPHSSMPEERHSSGRGYEYLTDEVAKAFVSVLRRHCAEKETCWAATWEGFGDSPSFTDSYPHKSELRFPGGGHGHLISRGSLSHIEAGGAPDGIWPEFLRSPNYWWPDGREWLVGSEIDTGATYVGCSSDCATDLLALGIQGLVGVDGGDRAIPDF